MLIQYFKKNKNKDKNLAHKLYKRISKLSNNFVNSNNFFIKKDFETGFEVFSIFLIIYLKNIKDLKIKNFKKINQDLMDIFINDLDYVFREKGISDIKLGKHVKHYVKKFYFRLSNIQKYINEPDLLNFTEFIKNLKFLKHEKSLDFSEIIFEKFTKIQEEIKTI